MWRKRDKNKMGIETTQRKIEEGIEKKKTDESLVQKLFKKISSMSDKLDTVTVELEKIKNKEVIVSVSSDAESIKSEQKTNSSRIFIPSVDTEDMKVSASQVEKRTKKLNLSSSVDELSKLEND